MNELTDHHCTLPSLYPPDVGAGFQCPVCSQRYVAVLKDQENTPVWVRAEELQPVTEEEDPAEDHVIHTRVDLVPASVGVSTPLFLDLGSDQAIVVQPKPDQKDGELALNIVVGGGLPADVVAWMLGQAAEAMVNGIRAARFDIEVPR